jgi:hypothetical protein
MKALTVVRPYWLVTAALLIGWSINLYEALTRPTVDWVDAADLPLLVIISFTLIMLAQARTRGTDDGAAPVKKGAARYIVAGLAVAGLVAAVVLGFRAHG